MTEWSKEIMAKNIKKYMEKSGMTQQEMAEIVGVSPPTFSDWVNAKKYPRIDKVQKMADYFGILKSDLIEEKMTEEKEKDNEIITDIIVRMRKDRDFLSVVQSLYTLNGEQLKGVKQMLNAFLK